MTIKANELLTAEQVLDEVDEYCAQHHSDPAMGKAVAEAMREYFSRYGGMAPAVMRSLKLEKVTMWRRIS